MSGLPGHPSTEHNPHCLVWVPAVVDEPVDEPAEAVDVEAPYGRKADGSPRAKPGRKPRAQE